MSVHWEGMNEFNKWLSNAGGSVQKAAAAELYRQGERIMTDSKARYVPVDRGALRGSGHVKQPHISGSRVEVELGYGGAAKAYALVQHEAMHFQHTVGGPKYLERPVKAARRRVSDAVGRAIQKALE